MSKAIQAQVAFLDSNISTTDDEIIVRDLNDIYDNQVVFVDPIMYFTIEPLSSTNQEIISCTGIEVVSDTKVRLTGVVRHLAAQPGVAGTPRSHGANQEIILTNTPQFYDGITFADEDETITGDWDFDASPTVPTPDSDLEVANKAYVDTIAILGSPDASTAAKGLSRISVSPTTTLGTFTVTIASPGVFTLASHGLTANDSVQFTTTGALPTGLLPSTTYYVIAAGLSSNDFRVSATYGGTVINTTGSQSGIHTLYKTTPVAVGANDTRLPTQGENDALVGNNTDIAVGTGNKMVTQTGLQKNAESYAATATGNDTYVITLSPVPTSLVNGMHLKFKADVANTGAATLNVNSLGAVSLVTGLSTALATGDIVANQVVEVVYNSTGPVFQVLNPASAVIVAPVFDYTLNSITDNATYFTTTVPILGLSASTLAGWTVSNLAVSFTNSAASMSKLGSSGGINWSILAALPGTGSTDMFTPGLTGKELRLKNWMRFGSTGNRTAFGIVVTAATIYTAETDITDGTIRFIRNGGTLYAHNSNGTTATYTDVTGGRTLTDKHIYEIVYNPGTDIKFYIDGTLVATHTTNMPISGNLSLAMGTDTNGRELFTSHPILTIKQ